MPRGIRKAHGSGSGSANSTGSTLRGAFANFPELQHLGNYDDWLASRDLRIESLWTRVGRAHKTFTCYILHRSAWKRTLVIVMQAGTSTPTYMRLYDTDAEARADSDALAEEVAVQPPRARDGQPPFAGDPWCARIVERVNHCELQIMPRGLVPDKTRIFATLDEAERAAEEAATRHYIPR